MPTVTWNPVDKNSAVTLTNGNLTVNTTNTSVWAAVRATTAYSFGKLYLELSLTGGTPDITIGLSTLAQILGSNSYMGSTTNSIGYEPNNSVYYYNGGGTALMHGVNGQTVCVAYDFTNGLIWWRLNAGVWNNSGIADPATQTGGINFRTLIPGGNWYPSIAVFTSGDTSTVNFGATAFSFTMPSGFNSFNTGPTPTDQVPTDKYQRTINNNQLFYNDQTILEDEYAANIKARRKPKVTSWAQAIESVYKFVQYDVVGPSDVSVSVNKTIQYSVLIPPDADVSVNKTVQYAVLVPPDNRVSVNKSIIYTVLESPSLLKRNDIYKKYAQFFQKQARPFPRRSKGVPLGKRLYVFTIT